MNSIYLQLNFHKKNHNKLLTYTQETNTTSDKYEEKTKSSLIPIQMNNNIKYKDNYYLKRYENFFLKKLVIKYNVLPDEYNKIQLDNFISAKYCHNLASFKEKLIFNDVDEFLKQFYKLLESRKEIPKFSQFYKSYLNFFCFPTFSELKFNELIEEMVEKKAKIFYNEKYKDELNEQKLQKKNNYTIFTEKIRHELSSKNPLTGLSQATSIINNLSNKGSLTSINTINIIIDILDKNNNKSIFNLNKNNELIKKENKEFKTERTKKLGIDYNNNILNDDIIIKSNYISDRNNKEKILNIKKNIENNNKISNKKNLMKIIKSQYLSNQLNLKKKSINKLLSFKKNSNNINKKENKNKCNINGKIEINNLYYKIKNNNLIKQIISLYNKKKTKDYNNNNDGKRNNNTDREIKHYIPNITKKNNKIKNRIFDTKFQTFLKVALNFNKSSPKKRQVLYYKKINNKCSKQSLTDRNKSNKLKNKININSYLTSNLTEYIKYNEKSSIQKEQKRLNPNSRNYKNGLESIKTSIIKTSLKNKNKKKVNNNCCNSSKKRLNSYNKYKIITKNYYKYNTQKTLKTSKEATSFSKRENCHLNTINLTQLYTKDKKKRISNLKTINLKKSLLPLNKLIIKTINISNNNII